MIVDKNAGSSGMGRPPIGKKAMSATERQRRWRAKLRASKPGVQPAASTALVKRLQSRVRVLEADNAALWTMLGKHRAAMEKILLQRMGAGSRKRKASRNQRHAAARRLARELDGVTGYQRACDIIWGPALAKSSATTKPGASTRAGRKGARAGT
jgi:hypothetical protein